MEKYLTSSVVPTITSGAPYASGNAIGGLLTFTGLADAGEALILSGVVLDKSGQNAACDLVLFNAAVAAPTDKAAVAISSADLQKAIGVISFATADFASVGTGGVGGKSKGNLNIASTSADNNLYGVLISRGTPTYVSTSDITVVLTAKLPRFPL